MPGDISKHTKYIVNLPYPEPRAEGLNEQYANILLKDYAGEVSEFTAVSLYSYQHFVSDEIYNDYAELVGGISIAEMKHMELLGETIKILGVKPIYTDNAFTIIIREMLAEDIRSEIKAIENYKYHISIIDDKYIRELLHRIIMDEELHLKLFNKMYEKYSGMH